MKPQIAYGRAWALFFAREVLGLKLLVEDDPGNDHSAGQSLGVILRSVRREENEHDTGS